MNPRLRNRLGQLQDLCECHLRLEEPLARYTSARIGGPAEVLVEAASANMLAELCTHLWEWELPFVLLGGGSNVLISDSGIEGVVVVNKANSYEFIDGDPPCVWAESGANFGLLARQAADRGFSGLEWAAGIPGTLGGAIFGNAGAHGGDMAGSLEMAEILHLPEREAGAAPRRQEWKVERFDYSYRSSALKRERLARPAHFSEYPSKVILSGRLRLKASQPETVREKMDHFTAYRRRTQPPGASMGSMFKNPPGDYAGRLIEAAGLKGYQVGGAQISPLHANFFINLENASAAEVRLLIQHAQQEVKKRFGVTLELEIEMLGNWESVS